MLGPVSAYLLNVRNMPTITDAIIGQLTKGMIIVATPMHSCVNTL
ncbi:hypothetical protein GPLA_2075 [Paraglaciecola polaris LMG 21857]|uniref:Uncharacterized protein n=1 Tax=Paraglaciecola polaris LMG 21857 TaxID=1129793 RepID=K7ACA0_9ALTE|nr:hypothetical protein GPLA_2075 [Paraglaciecola polaris LMG 21857]